MSALEQLAAAVLDGRVHITVQTTAVSAFGIPIDADFQIEVDPIDEDDEEEEASVTAGNAADQFGNAEAMNESLLQMSDLFSGGVATLMGEGWTEEQARGIVVAAFAAGSRGAK